MSTQPCLPNPTPSTPREQVRAIHDQFTIDPMGILAIGSDGVFRSLTAERKILNAVGLSTPQIKALLDSMPFHQDTEDKFRGVDGTKTPVEKWWNPDEGVLPEPLGEKERMEAEREVREHEEKVKRGEVTEGGECCAPRPRADYNLGPK
nr:hypothetical protein B0A51_16830 [Rachicladosporium sp. CCFEE 5018]